MTTRTTAPQMRVSYNYARGGFPELPPREVVPKGALKSHALAANLVDEAKRLSARRYAIPQERVEAEKLHQQAVVAAASKGRILPQPDAIKGLDDELEIVESSVDGVAQAAQQAVTAFGNEMLALVDGVRAESAADAAACIELIEQTLAQLDEQADELRAAVGRATWASNIMRTPRYAPAALGVVADSMRAARAELDRLSFWADKIADETGESK